MTESLGSIIKAAIKEKGFSFNTVARKMGVSRQTIGNLDLRKRFDLEFLENLKTATGLDYTDYFKKTGKNGYDDPTIPESTLNEPDGLNDKRIEMSLTVKISADSERLKDVGELLIAFKKEAKRQGFELL